MASGIYEALGVIADFDDSLCSPDEDRRQIIIKHLKCMDKLNYRVPDFRCGLEWLNTSKSLSLKDNFQGQVVILDFFTYCCINCMHILPDLEEVEKAFTLQSGVAVIGVHSAKFMNEKITANILSAVLRYDIKHPVVNDQDAVLWQELAVSCWPTLVFVGPKGQLIYSLAGEGHRSWIMEFLKVATDHYSSELRPCILPLSLEKYRLPDASLCFPGKVSYWQEKDWLVIADTGNHRIVVTDSTGVVQMVIGSGQPGLKDGSFASAKFNGPQGIVCDHKCIYVADTNNHCLRRLDLRKQTVTTIAGTGKLSMDHVGGNKGTQQEIASPWDLVLGTSPTDVSSPVLLVAMAGTHQIWVYFLKDTTWYRGSSYTEGTCLRFAGSGLEENRNNSYPEKAGFAQPSGLALSGDGSNQKLYIADSESSSIRAISLADRKVTGVVGGEKDPKNLFAYGDIDGIGTNAKLQHPLGVASMDGKLVIADSYNHKVKLVDLSTLHCQTYMGSGRPGSRLESADLSLCELSEPGGVAVNEANKTIYIADTNNHAIKVINYASATAYQLPIIFTDVTNVEDGTNQEPGLPDQAPKPEKRRETITLPEVTSAVASGSVTLTVPIKLREGEHVNTEAPNSWKGCGGDQTGQQLWSLLSPSERKGKLQVVSANGDGGIAQASLTIDLPSNRPVGRCAIEICTQIFKCLNEDNACLPPEQTHFTQILNLS